MPKKNFDTNLNYDITNNNTNFKFLVFAGSQGSLDILTVFKKIIYELNKMSNLKKIEFIIQCPLTKHEEIKDLLLESNFDYQIKDFFTNFEYTLNKVNIALCRSGAGTINDLINFKIPSIICPLPNAKDNHQYENAKILSNAECAIIINKDKIDMDLIKQFMKKVIDDKDFNKSLIDKFSQFKSVNASEMMWKYIEDDQKK